MNIELVSYYNTQPNTGAAMTVCTGDPATIRNATKGTDVLMLGLWAKSQAVSGYGQILWPSGHDLVRGVRFRHVYAQGPDLIQPRGFTAHFQPQDPLTLSISGSTTSGDVQHICMLLWYEDLPGVDAHLIDLPTLRKRGVQTLTIEDSITPTATGLTYSGSRALNAASDLLQADTEYAIVGGGCGVIAAACTIRGPDTGNLRFGFPGNSADFGHTQDIFMQLAEFHALPCIPVINSANRAGTFVEMLQDENNTAVPFFLNLVELAPA